MNTAVKPLGATDDDYNWWREAGFDIFIHFNTSWILDLKADNWDQGHGHGDSKYYR